MVDGTPMGRVSRRPGSRWSAFCGVLVEDVADRDWFVAVGAEPAEDIALGYKQLLEVERGWRDMKQIIDLRPVYHRLEERIRAHVILCWLALLLIRIIETTAGDTWSNIRRHLNRLHVGTFTGPAGTFRQRTELTKPQRDLLAKLAIATPKQIVELEPA